MLSFVAALVFADITHVVQRGHTIEAIAHRYHVSEKAIATANHLKDAKHLKPGQVLLIPGVESGPKKKDRPEKGAKPDKEKAEHAERSDKGDKGRPTSHMVTTAALDAAAEPRGRASEVETIHAVRSGEEFQIRLKDAHGHIPPSAMSAFERMMRQDNATHPPDPRLIVLVGIVSSHFGDKPIEVVSGYRAYTSAQYSPHSNHNLGRALDFRIRGVNNVALSDFCRTLRSAGCGYYPNSSFVHLDVRDTKAFWIDRAGPGEPPKYDSPDAGADETTSEVPAEPSDRPPSAPTDNAVDPRGNAPIR